jgi:two-component system OmpR family response regulator
MGNAEPGVAAQPPVPKDFRESTVAMRLLLVEDSVRLQQLAGDVLREAGYAVDTVSGAVDCETASAGIDYDLFIVDLGLPDGDGLDLIRTLRARKHCAPVLVITARVAVEDRVAGLDCGADDYLCKPFHHGELIARVRALLRRNGRLVGPDVKVGGVTLNLATGEARAAGAQLALRPRERQLLEILIRREGQVVPRAVIEDALSEFGRETSPNAIELLVSRLRKALERAHARVDLQTFRGLGYMLKERT